MARKLLPRNEIGQFKGDVPRQVKARVEEFAQELFQEFPDVDVFDLERIVVRELAFQASMQMLKDANTTQEEK